MWFRTIGVAIACALLTLTRGQGSNDDEAEENFNIEALFDSNVTLYCNDSTLQGDFTFDYWIRPDISVMLTGEADVFRILDGEASWEVSHDGMELWVVHLQERQFGVYFCVGKVDDGTSSRVVVVKRGLNANGPYFGNLWPEYRLNTIIGLSAAGGYLLVVAILYGTYHFRYRGEEEGEEEEQVTEERGQEREMFGSRAQAIKTVAATDGTGYDNEAFPRTRLSSGSTLSEQEFRF